MIMVMRNDLTVIRGQAQLMKRALAHDHSARASESRERLDAIITSVDDASLELHRLQSGERLPHSAA